MLTRLLRVLVSSPDVRYAFDLREVWLGWNWQQASLAEKILRLRRMVLVNSIIYYRLNRSIISDAFFDEIAYELASYQKVCPEFCAELGYFDDEFADFNGETGFHLPLYDPRATNVAQRLVQWYDQDLAKFKAAHTN